MQNTFLPYKSYHYHFQSCHQPFFLASSSDGGDNACFSSYNCDIDKNISTVIKIINHSPYERLISINFSYAGTGLSNGFSHIVGIYLIAYPIIEPNNPPIAKTSDNFCFLVE